jgi:hypothetical protein
MAAQRLRSVTADDAAPKRLSVAEAAKSGNRRKLLMAMRDRIAQTISDTDCPPRDLASLTRRLQDIAKEIDQLDLLDSESRSVVAETDDDPFDAASV